VAATKIYLHYEPKLYSDLIQQVFQNIGQEVIVGIGDAESNSRRLVMDKPECGEFLLLSLENLEVPLGDQVTNLMPDATIIAFSPSGEFGYRRLPGETKWEEIRPFGIAELLNEVLSEGN
jgi:hypothetical protein